MSEYIVYVVTIATSMWTTVLEHIGEEIPGYMAYAFCLISVLLAFCACFYLAIALFRFVCTLLRRGGGL